MIKVALLTIGSELLDGRTQDTNANFLAKLLRDNSFSVTSILTCADELSSITDALKFAGSHDTDLIITSGGLGPTSDDLTREAAADFFQVALNINQTEVAKQKKRYADRGREFPESNIKQATFPDGAEIIVNNFGTAPAFHCKKEHLHLIALPGVPSELKGIFQEEILPLINRIFSPEKIYSRRFVFFNVPESAINDQVSSLSLPSEVEVIYETTFPENKLILKSKNEEQLHIIADQINNLPAAKHLVATGLQNMIDVVHARLITSKQTLALAESCTGGLISKLLTDMSGSAQYLLGSLVTYNNSAKKSILGVSSETLEKHSAVSAECALEMALGAKQRLNSDLAISVTGIAGPPCPEDEKPAGTVFFGYADQERSYSEEIFFPGTRAQIRQFAAYYALHLLLRKN